MDLNDVLDEKKEVRPEVEVKTEEKPEVEAKPEVERVVSIRGKHREKEQDAKGERVRNEKGQFEAKEEVKEEVKPEEAKPEVKAEVKAEKPEAQELTAKERAFLKNAESERAKRQALEQEIANLRSQLPKPEQQPQQRFQDNPEGYMAGVVNEMNTALIRNRLDTSDALARRAHADYPDKLQKFTEMCHTVPGLFQQMLQQPDPAEFAYKTAKTHEELESAGSIDELRAKIETDTRAKVEAEIRAKIKAEEEARQAAAAALPGSLSKVTGAGAPSRVSWSGPTSLDSILK